MASFDYYYEAYFEAPEGSAYIKLAKYKIESDILVLAFVLKELMFGVITVMFFKIMQRKHGTTARLNISLNAQVCWRVMQARKLWRFLCWKNCDWLSVVH